MRPALALAAVLAALAAPTLRAQDPAERERTFRAVLFLVPTSEAASGDGLRVERLQEVWGEGESADKLAAYLKGVNPEKLQALTIKPGQDAAVVQYDDLTFRISGLYRGPRRDRMYLKVSFDQGGRAAVKEILAGLDETVLVGYPLLGAANGSVVALLIPTR
ncbi:MAG TPA: hypothetical protein VIC56_03375 [Gemmatimonadota bacterium]|jgi:hypothetical protein